MSKEIPVDFSHLNAIELRLSNERMRLAKAKTHAEMVQRQVWVSAAERELQSEREFLGMSRSVDAISDDELLAELTPSDSCSIAFDWPVVVHPLVFHIGHFDPALKGSLHRESLEGNGLSVSMHPLAWQKIAKLGGAPAWQLSCTDGIFLDVLELSEAHFAYVLDWAQKSGYVRSNDSVIRVGWIDDELGDDRVYMDFDGSTPEGRLSAQAEFDDKEECDGTFECLIGWSSTEAMNARAGFPVSLSLARDIALTFFVEDVLFEGNGIHGAWWNEHLDASSFSAPRGVIHLKALAFWDVLPAPAESLPTEMHADELSDYPPFERE